MTIYSLEGVVSSMWAAAAVTSLLIAIIIGISYRDYKYCLIFVGITIVCGIVAVYR